MTVFSFSQLESFVSYAFQDAGLSQVQLNSIVQVLSDGTSGPGQIFQSLMNQSATVGTNQGAVFYEGQTSLLGRSFTNSSLSDQILR